MASKLLTLPSSAGAPSTHPAGRARSRAPRLWPDSESSAKTRGTPRYHRPRSATSCQVVYDDDHVIHNTQLAAASAGVTSFGSLMAICAALSDSALR